MILVLQRLLLGLVLKRIVPRRLSACYGGFFSSFFSSLCFSFKFFTWNINLLELLNLCVLVQNLSVMGLNWIFICVICLNIMESSQLFKLHALGFLSFNLIQKFIFSENCVFLWFLFQPNYVLWNTNFGLIFLNFWVGENTEFVELVSLAWGHPDWNWLKIVELVEFKSCRKDCQKRFRLAFFLHFQSGFLYVKCCLFGTGFYACQ